MKALLLSGSISMKENLMDVARHKGDINKWANIKCTSPNWEDDLHVSSDT